MKIIVVGCGRFGAELAYRLFQHGNEVAVVDALPAAFNNLPADFKGRLNEGDALNQDVLHRAGIETADAVAVVTNSDALNAAVGHIAQSKYNVKYVVARDYDPNLRALYETFGLQVIAATSWGAQRMEEMLSHSDVHTIFSAGNGEVEVYEFTVPESCDGKKLSDVIGPGSLAVAVTRAGRSLLPETGFVLEACDIVNISATLEGIQAVRAQLQGQRKEK
jgi:trk system potassium uptake protein